MNFLQIFAYLKPVSPLKLIFRTTEMWQTAIIDTFQKVLSASVDTGTNLAPIVAQTSKGQDLQKLPPFFQGRSIFEFSCTTNQTIERK